jgi:hypothetical protein
MPKHLDGPKTPPPIVRPDQPTEPRPITDAWKKNRKTDEKARKKAMEQQRADRLARDKKD